MYYKLRQIEQNDLKTVPLIFIQLHKTYIAFQMKLRILKPFNK